MLHAEIRMDEEEDYPGDDKPHPQRTLIPYIEPSKKRFIPRHNNETTSNDKAYGIEKIFDEAAVGISSLTTITEMRKPRPFIPWPPLAPKPEIDPWTMEPKAA